MLIKLQSVAILGLETVGVEVEVNIASKSFPGFSIVGLPNKAIDEAKERVRTALINSSIEFPQKRITVNLALADLPKEGSCYDLPIALGLLAREGIIPKDKLRNFFVVGGLSLDGKTAPVRGILAIASILPKGSKLIVPKANAEEAALIGGVESYGVEDLGEAIAFLTGMEELSPAVVDIEKELAGRFDFYSQVSGKIAADF